MNIDIIETHYESIKSECLRSIAQNRSTITKIYIAKIGRTEVGIMTVDCYSPPLPLFIYFIFVKEGHRMKGIGTILLDYAERLATERGNTSIVLQPHEVEENISKKTLIDWYKRKGFSQRAGDPSRLEKILMGIIHT